MKLLLLLTTTPISSLITLLTTTLLLLLTINTQALITFEHVSNGTVFLSATNSYTPQIGSVQNFPPMIQFHVVWVGDLCEDTMTKISSAVNNVDNTVYVFSTVFCDHSIGLNNLEIAGVKYVVSLYDPDRAADPHDTPIRYAFRPTNNLIHVRIPGYDSGVAKRLLLAVNSSSSNAADRDQLRVNITYRRDLWLTNCYLQPFYLFYMILSILFFCVYLPQHIIRAWMVRDVTGKQNLQRTYLLLSVVLIVNRILDWSTEIARDFFGNWVPEVITQYFYFFPLVVLCLQVAALIFFWAEVLQKTHTMNLHGLQSTRPFLICLGVFLFVLVIVVVPCYVYYVPGYYYVRQGGFVIVGLVAITECVGVLIFGGRVLQELLRDPLADSGGGGGHEVSKARRVAARKRALPMTRLVMVVAVFGLIATIIAFAAAASTILETQETFPLFFFIVTICEIAIYGIVTYQLSPIWQARKKKWKDTTTDQDDSHTPKINNEGSFRQNNNNTNAPKSFQELTAYQPDGRTVAGSFDTTGRSMANSIDVRDKSPSV
jgi:hypothetical protein